MSYTARFTPRTLLMMSLLTLAKNHKAGGTSRRHAVCAAHCAQGDSILISAFVTHYPYTLDGEQNRPRLPNVVVQARITQS